jgi:hypothetical protein
MSMRPSRRGVQGLGIGLVAVPLALILAGSVMAGSGSPDTIAVSQTGPLTVQASGTWSWGEMASATKLSYGGYAIDWGDVTSGNAVGTYHIGDGTSATNVVLQPTTPAQGSSGSWGSVSHTYATPGTYTVCVIMYDLGQVKPFKTTGYHSLQAGGTGRNTDNSVDNKQQVPSMCEQIDVTSPSPSTLDSPTPFQSFQGITFEPTAPPTGTVGVPPAQDQGLPILPLFLLFGSCAASLLVFKAVKVNR